MGILKRDILFETNDLLLYMFNIIDNNIQKTVDAVTNAYPVLDYVVKSNWIYVITKSPRIEDIKYFDIETAYTYCINTFNKSQPYFESEICKDNVLLTKDTFNIMPMGTDVFDLQPKTNKEFKENVLDQVEECTGQRNEKLFDKLFKELYNTNKSGENNG